ncbi:cytochrome-c peroxidase [Rhodovulum sp. 12E13]|uniref:cytochrome-c peroxidase n=1 Tax=Rhodovulum sp. 12E13 TaxID=2203891 RepID=UPI000E13F18B|nr:cytochrome c peroxidase [Rhodovulum sp. 12E13]RDC72294.1 cytochrome-c peroxidase [Rhodovulum sp. 12E13]
MRIMCIAAALAAAPVLAAPDLGPAPVFAEVEEARARLGWLLFYDPVLSGSGEVACATCHHPRFGTSDGVSLSLGDGGLGLGPERVADPANLPLQRIPRNATGLWNLGAQEFTVFFHDGRLEEDPTRPGGIRTPLGEEMVSGFDSALAAQAMFPVLSPDEMAGHYGENDIAEAVGQGMLAHEGGAWDRIAARVAAIPAYADAFAEVAPGQAIDFPLIANVIADFIRFEWRADDSAFDRHMRGETPLEGAAARGMALFYGDAGCAECHSGWFQTDHRFHAIAMPQIGPGKAGRFEAHHRDEGRMRVTNDPADAYRFRTPSLRNVTLTAPYGHSGAYAALEDVVRHHLDPVGALERYDLSMARLPELPGVDDLWALRAPDEVARIAAANELAPVALSDADVAEILAFLAALEDDAERLGVPEAVPSGLPVDR